jgi:glycosyltransferase involved in cell wall biosynthesis
MGLNFDFHPVDSGECSETRNMLGLGAEPYFMHVGGDHPRKNRAFVVEMFAALVKRRPDLPHQLLLVGAPIGPDVRSAIIATNLGARVVSLGRISNEQLRALYSGAAALFFPSLLEGFGWPIIEAQACGCPVITSDRRPMKDIGGDAALYIDPLDFELGAEKIANELPTFDRRREGSLRNAAQYSAKEMTRDYVSAYRTVYDSVNSKSE